MLKDKPEVPKHCFEVWYENSGLQAAVMVLVSFAARLLLIRTSFRYFCEENARRNGNITEGSLM